MKTKINWHHLIFFMILVTFIVWFAYEITKEWSPSRENKHPHWKEDTFEEDKDLKVYDTTLIQ